jgi:hypothetical protein
MGATDSPDVTAVAVYGPDNRWLRRPETHTGNLESLKIWV